MEEHCISTDRKPSRLEPRKYPCILACGYRNVLIPRTGRTFPAWCIAFDEERVVWRSKHDLWLLHRSMKPDRTIEFPKAVFLKLAEASPWKSPQADTIEGFRTLKGAADDVEERSDVANNNWHVKLLKNLRRVNQFLQACSLGREGTHIPAWVAFSRPEHTENLVCSRTTVGSSSISSLSAPTARCNPEAERLSHELGQYFCSPENAQLLLDTCFQRLDECVSDATDQLMNLVFVEPSVGRGDIIAALQIYERDQSDKYRADRILGFDLDASAIECSRKRCNAPNTSLYLTDFLQTKRRNYSIEEEALLVVIGGPPYTEHSPVESAQHRPTMDRTIPIRFVEHAIHEWRATLIVFLMPKRCQNYSYQHILPANYQLETFQLPSSTFFFQGKQPVTQPSVLQCFWMRPGVKVHSLKTE